MARAGRHTKSATHLIYARETANTRPVPFADTPQTREDLLHDKLTALVDNALDRMIETGNIEPGLLSLVADATATRAALDARKQSKETA